MLLLGSLAFLLLTPRKEMVGVAPYLLASIPSAVLVGKVGSDVNYLWSYRRRSARQRGHLSPGSAGGRGCGSPS